MRTYLRWILWPLASLVGAGALAQTPKPSSDTATLTFSDSAPREVWVQEGPCSGPTADSVKPGGSAVEVNLAGKKPDDNVYIWDHQAGTMASTTVDALRKALNLTVDPKLFRDVAEVKVRLEHLARPVAAAEVTVSDGAKVVSRLVTPSANGELTYYDLKPGSLKVTAKYQVKDGKAQSVTQLLDAQLGKGDPAAVGVISVPDDVDTVAASGTAPASGAASPANTTNTSDKTNTTNATSTSSAPGPAPAPASGNPIGSVLSYLLGLLIVAGIVYLLWRYAKQNPDMVSTKLQQLGVDIPKPGDAPHQYDAPVTPVAPAAPQPIQQIILGDAAPEPTSAAPMATAATVMTVAGEPQLRSESGDAMTLQEGETVVGRDAGLGLSLVGESTVSRRHAHLVRNGNEVTVADLGSTNGTYVNGAQLTGPQTLRPGDTVQFGAVRFRFEG